MKLTLLSLFILLAVSSALQSQAAEVKDWDTYLKECEQKISEDWLGKEMSAFQIPPHFRDNAKGVISFYLDSEGRVSKARVLHSSQESLRVAALRIYSVRGLGLLKAMDKAMLSAVEKSAPLPAPPWKLKCPRKFVVVFDTQRLKPLRIYVDDRIPIYQTSIPQVFF
ncbi:MAG: TonB C-terminal domain-containing protein [Candidatus Obscuribacterales bacterium]|nr:TonB C-terminal domain-containing protein [Candidatus Obscuribacterales bacterium]